MKTIVMFALALMPGLAAADAITDVIHFDDAYGNTDLYALGYENELAGYALSVGGFEYNSNTAATSDAMYGQFVSVNRRFSNALRVKARLYLNHSGPDFGNITVFGETTNGISHEESCERDFASLNGGTYFQGCALSVGMTKGDVYGSVGVAKYAFSDDNSRDVTSLRLGYNITESATVEVFTKRSRDSEPSPLYFSPDEFTSTRIMARYVFRPVTNLSVKVGAGGGPESISGEDATAKYADALLRYDHRNISVFIKAERKWSPGYAYNYGTASIVIHF